MTPPRQAGELAALAKAWADAAENLGTAKATTLLNGDRWHYERAEAAFRAALAGHAAEIERLTKALEPFAKAWDYSCHPNAGEGLPWNTTWQHYKAASEALRVQATHEGSEK
jgi:hypothetical protein